MVGGLEGVEVRGGAVPKELGCVLLRQSGGSPWDEKVPAVVSAHVRRLACRSKCKCNHASDGAWL